MLRDSMRTSKFIREARSSLKLTQFEFSQLLQTGDKCQVSKWENGVCEPKGSVILKVFDLLGQRAFEKVLSS